MGQSVKEHLRLALRMMLKPLVKLLISQGVSHGDFSEAAKDVYVEVAIRHFDKATKVNQSRVAILTGLTRKEVKNVIDRAMRSEPHGKNFSRPSRVLAGWHSDPLFLGPYGMPLEIPYESPVDGGIPSFVDLVRTYSGDMAPRQMLNQLIESGSVVEVDRRYKAVNRAYTHSQLSPSSIRRLGDVGYRVFSSAAKNIDRQDDSDRHFDRMVYADDGCTSEVIELFDEYVRVRGQAFLEELDVWFSSRRELNRPGEERKETGLYMVHYVEDEDELGTLRSVLTERGLTAIDD